MYRGIPRCRGSGSSILNYLTMPQLRRKAMNSVSAVQDTFYSTKDLFERHRVVFTVGTSIASVLMGCAGYSMRHYRDTKVDQRLESIEKAMKNSHHIENPEFKKLVAGFVTLPTCVATAGTSLIIGYGLGWRCGAWYVNRKIRREQLKLLGQIKPKKWPLKFLRRPLLRSRLQENASNMPEQKGA